MKITKGMTIEQLIDYLNDNGLDANRYVFNYNNRLKDALTEGVIVNPYGIDKPIDNKGFLESTELFNERLDKWQEAEDKVILEGWYKINNCFANGNYRYASGWLDDIGNGGITTEINTLGDLFRATNGELETKNFNI